MNDMIKSIALELQLNQSHVASAVQLLFEQGCTIPFVARYRKEITGSMDEGNLRLVRDRYTYITELEQAKERYLKVVAEHCKSKPELHGKFPELEVKFKACTTKQELEDLYLPFKPKRRTRAMVAKEKGLEPLTDRIMADLDTISDLSSVVQNFLAQAGLVDRVTPEEAIAGAGDILAERINETAEFRAIVRKLSLDSGTIVSKKIEGAASAPVEGPAASKGKKEGAGKYENYFDYRESIHKALSHRIMAVRRGEAEKILRLGIEVDDETILRDLSAVVIAGKTLAADVADFISKTVQDSYKRLLAPSIETEIRLSLKNRAEDEAISVFAKNLEKLLMLPPIPRATVCGIDPGIRTGSKLAIISPSGKLLEYAVVNPDPVHDEAERTKAAREKIRELVHRHHVECIAIGNGTGSQRIEHVVRAACSDPQAQQKVKIAIVNEAGASVYSTDDIAREEFPDLDPTIRSAVSIGRRLQDPLAELVKIDPRSVGVGQYQHDCDVNKLIGKLQESVESCVNNVGVNLNTASHKLLSYVSGIGTSLAKSVVAFRDNHGDFTSRHQLLEVSGFGPKTFEQAAGFLRIPEGSNPLDNSAVHPERYSIVEEIGSELQIPLKSLLGNKDVIDSIAWEKYVSATLGMPTLLDIAKELLKPGRDPREDGTRLRYSQGLRGLEDLKIDMKLKGTVSNVTAFGAFVDIGVHQDGLVHVSELADQFVKDPSTVVAVGDVLDVRVIAVDLERKRISLSCRSKPAAKPAERPVQQGQSHQQSGQQGSQHPRQAPTKPFTKDRRPTDGRGQHPSSQRPDSRPSSQSRSDNRSSQQQRPSRHGAGNGKRSGGNRQPEKSFSVNDLLAKFNSRD